MTNGSTNMAAPRAERTMLQRIIQYPLVLMVIATCITVIGMIIGGVISNLLPREGDTPFDLLAACVVAAFGVAAYLLFCRYVEEAPVRDFETRGWAKELGAGMAGGALLFALVVGVVALLGGYRIVGPGSFATIWTMLALAVISGVTEELIFRGIFFRFIEKAGGSAVALAITSAFFGLAHAWNPNATPFSSLAIAIEAGVLLGAIYMYTRRLWAVIGLHAAWNFTQGWIFDVPVSGGDANGIVEAERPGPELLTGGGFGLEASVVALVLVTAAGIAILYLAVKRGHLVAPFWRRGREAAAAR